MRLPRPDDRCYAVCVGAGVAQSAEQLICNQQVVGSSPTASSKVSSRRTRAQTGVAGSLLLNRRLQLLYH